MRDTATFTQRVRDLFLAHPNQWLDGLALARIAGQYAWRSRVSDARRQYGLRIENRVRTVRDVADGRVLKVSEYRYVPPTPARPDDWVVLAPVNTTPGRLF